MLSRIFVRDPGLFLPSPIARMAAILPDFYLQLILTRRQDNGVNKASNQFNCLVACRLVIQSVL